jgi:hypothetical protein
MGKMSNIIKVIALLAIILFILTSCGGEKSMIIADEPTKVYSEYPDSGMPKQDKVIAVLNENETSDVLQIKHSKDFQYYRVRLRDGREGYIQFGDKFRVISKNK